MCYIFCIWEQFHLIWEQLSPTGWTWKKWILICANEGNFSLIYRLLFQLIGLFCCVTLYKNPLGFCQLTACECKLSGTDFPDLLTALPESCSGPSSASSRRHAVAYTHWSSSSWAPASASPHSLELSQGTDQYNTKTTSKYKLLGSTTWSRSPRHMLVNAEHPRWVVNFPGVVFIYSPQQNLPIGCPGLARLPNNISFLCESDGLASWYSKT